MHSASCLPSSGVFMTSIEISKVDQLIHSCGKGIGLKQHHGWSSVVALLTTIMVHWNISKLVAGQTHSIHTLLQVRHVAQ